jgi:hypothetical protein
MIKINGTIYKIYLELIDLNNPPKILKSYEFTVSFH